MPWIEQKDDAVYIHIRVVPNASKNEVQGEHDGALKIRLTAPARDGRANKALVQFMAKTTGLPKSRVAIVKGDKSRLKTIQLDQAELKNVVSRLF